MNNSRNNLYPDEASDESSHHDKAGTLLAVPAVIRPRALMPVHEIRPVLLGCSLERVYGREFDFGGLADCVQRDFGWKRLTDFVPASAGTPTAPFSALGNGPGWSIAYYRRVRA